MELPGPMDEEEGDCGSLSPEDREGLRLAQGIGRNPGVQSHGSNDLDEDSFPRSEGEGPGDFD